MRDIEGLLISWLQKAVGVAACGDVPEDRPDEFLTVERTGGSRSYGIDTATVAVQCWSTSRAAACELAHRVDAALPSLIGEGGVFGVERDSLYNFPDEEGGTARYQIVATVTTV